MTVRVRHSGLAALAILAGASLLQSSMAVSAPRSLGARTLSLSLRQRGDRLDGPAAWIVEGRPAKTWRLAKEGMTQLPQGTAVDGLVLRALVVKIGRQRPRPVLTDALTAGELLRALDVDLDAMDVVKPAADAVLWEGMRFQVIRIRQVSESSTVTLPFRTLIQYSKDLGPGQTRLLKPGRNGTAVWTWQVTYRNGREVSRVLVSEQIVEAPLDQLIELGKNTAAHGIQVGQASWYDFCRIDGNYAAHLTLPFGTVVTVTNLDNGKTVTVVINDRGPYGVRGRIIDLCDAAFARIAPLSQGVANVQISW